MWIPWITLEDDKEFTESSDNFKALENLLADPKTCRRQEDTLRTRAIDSVCFPLKWDSSGNLAGRQSCGGSWLLARSKPCHSVLPTERFPVITVTTI